MTAKPLNKFLPNPASKQATRRIAICSRPGASGDIENTQTVHQADGGNN